MEELIDLIEEAAPSFLPILCLVTIIVISWCSINFLKRVWYSIPTKVNCWFCNNYSKVDYNHVNSFVCSHCQQYNGFTPDGHYNKRISAQYIESLNRPPIAKKLEAVEEGSKFSNILCAQCNLNQELKVFQIASFVPSNEKYYEKEIELERKRLEEVYALCSMCNISLRKFLKKKAGEISRNSADLKPGGSQKVEPQKSLNISNLQIGSPLKKDPTPPQLTSSLPSSSRDSPKNENTDIESLNLDSIWKDYPQIKKGMTGSPPSPALSINSSLDGGGGPFGPYSYRSSSVASIFGGRKSLVSPPKFFGHYNTFSASQLSPYYVLPQSSHSLTPSPNGSGVYSPHLGSLSHLAFHQYNYTHPFLTQELFYSPYGISRSSSQSSGFISQKEMDPFFPGSSSYRLPSAPASTTGEIRLLSQSSNSGASGIKKSLRNSETCSRFGKNTLHSPGKTSINSMNFSSDEDEGEVDRESSFFTSLTSSLRLKAGNALRGKRKSKKIVKQGPRNNKSPTKRNHRRQNEPEIILEKKRGLFSTILTSICVKASLLLNIILLSTLCYFVFSERFQMSEFAQIIYNYIKIIFPFELPPLTNLMGMSDPVEENASELSSSCTSDHETVISN